MCQIQWQTHIGVILEMVKIMKEQRQQQNPIGNVLRGHKQLHSKLNSRNFLILFLVNLIQLPILN